MMVSNRNLPFQGLFSGDLLVSGRVPSWEPTYPFHTLVFLQYGSRLISPECLVLLSKPRDTRPASDGHVVDVHDVKENCLQTNNCHQLSKTLGLVNYDQIYPAKTYNCQSESQH